VRQEGKIALELRPIVLAAPQCHEVRDPEAQERATVIGQAMADHAHPTGTPIASLCRNYDVGHQ
jgi:hypothetical protein